LSDEIFMNLNRDKSLNTVHQANFPEINSNQKELIDNKLEEKMALAQKIVSNARSLRNEAQIKVRQPLSELLVNSENKSDFEHVRQLESIICEELNVKSIRLIENTTDIVSFSSKANFKQLGSRAGKLMGKLANEIKNLSREDLDSYLAKGSLKLNVNGQDFELYENDIEIITEAKEGLVAQKDKSLIIALNIVLTENLLTEGFAREFVNRVQNLRKEAEFEVTDHIEIEVTNSSDDIYQKLKDQKDYICNETLADSIIFNKLDSSFVQDVNINDEPLRIGLQKVN